jgi:hypothetical protein
MRWALGLTDNSLSSVRFDERTGKINKEENEQKTRK